MQQIPITTIDLFPSLQNKLLELLYSLTPQEWNQPTIAGRWTVKDVTAHLLDGSVRTISMLRDNHFSESPEIINGYDDLVHYLNNLNAAWVNAMKRVSPQLLITLLETTGTQYHQQLAQLDPFAPAVFAVSWAGDASSPNWFHIAREYTERWHHQQQIRDAVGKPGIMTKEFYYPVLDTFMMALPHTYRNVQAAANSVVQVIISGDAGGSWYLVKKDKWELQKTNSFAITARTVIDGEIAWKLFTKSWRKNEAMKYITIEGDIALGTKAVDMIAVM